MTREFSKFQRHGAQEDAELPFPSPTLPCKSTLHASGSPGFPRGALSEPQSYWTRKNSDARICEGIPRSRWSAPLVKNWKESLRKIREGTYLLPLHHLSQELSRALVTCRTAQSFQSGLRLALLRRYLAYAVVVTLVKNQVINLNTSQMLRRQPIGYQPAITRKPFIAGDPPSCTICVIRRS